VPSADWVELGFSREDGYRQLHIRNKRKEADARDGIGPESCENGVANVMNP
jgi:hypothetical protein